MNTLERTTARKTEQRITTLPFIRLSHYGEQLAYIHDMRQEGFALDVERDPPLAEGDMIHSVPFLKNWENPITGEELVERAEQEYRGTLAGQLHAEKLFKDVAIIHPGWEKYTHVFLGTYWSKPVGCRAIPCFTLGKSGWTLYFLFLGDLFTKDFRLVTLQRLQSRSSFIRTWADSQVEIWGP